jgi:anti-sigma B factor antagonist
MSDGDRLVIAVRGELDLGSASTLDRELRDAGSNGFSHVVIDLGELEFIDSTGLGVLVRAQQAATENGHRVFLRRGSNQVQRLFELTGLTEHFTFEDYGP